jgi:hypothetical protein
MLARPVVPTGKFINRSSSGTIVSLQRKQSEKMTGMPSIDHAMLLRTRFGGAFPAS